VAGASKIFLAHWSVSENLMGGEAQHMAVGLFGVAYWQERV
jgi:hypothetical protein